MSRLDDLELLELPDRASLRCWLSENHATSRGVWLAIGKKRHHRTALSYDDAVEEALAFGWIDSTARTLDEDRYRILYTPRKPSSTWARTNKARVKRLTEAGLMTEAGHAAIARAQSNGSWEILENVEALLIPDDLSAALAANPVAEQGFAALGDSVKQQVLYRVATAKRAETRERRIAEITAALIEGSPPIG